MSWVSGFRFREKLTIQQSYIDATLTDFPLLIKPKSSTFYSQISSNGLRKKIAVALADGTQCSVEVEKYEVNDTCLWVKIPSVSDTVDTDLYLYYDGEAEDNPMVGDPNDVAAENVWETACVFCSHMQDDPDTSHVRDSTSNDNDGTKGAPNEPVEIDGQVGKALSIDGINNYVIVSDSASLTLGSSDFTVALLFKIGTMPTFQVLIAKTRYGFMMASANPAEGFRSYIESSGISSDIQTGIEVRDNLWHYGVVVRKDNMAYLYLDGVSVGTPAVLTGSVGDGHNLVIGDTYDLTSDFTVNGIEDEVRIHNQALSATKIKAQYYSEMNQLLIYGGFEDRQATIPVLGPPVPRPPIPIGFMLLLRDWLEAKIAE